MKKDQIIALCFFLFIAGIAVGRKTIEGKVEIRYVQGDVVRDTIHEPAAVAETAPLMSVLPLRSDTVYLDNIIYVHVEVDTAAIINDYVLRREYATLLFDTPTLGKLSLFETVQYNKLSELQYEFFPVYKEVTVYKVPVWQPFVGTSFNTLGVTSVSVGTFYKKIGAEMQFVYDISRLQRGVGIGVKYRF